MCVWLVRAQIRLSLIYVQAQFVAHRLYSPTESQYVAPSATRPPVWPQDKHVSLAEAFHFAACAKRIGRRAKQENSRTAQSDEDGSVELGRPLGTSSSPLRSAWEILACCDGMCGAPLGMAVKSGFDSTIAWLCCCLTYGGQIVVEQAELRLSAESSNAPPSMEGGLAVTPSDFDQRPGGYEKQESAKMVHPKPIPEVLETLKRLLTESGDSLTPGGLFVALKKRNSKSSMSSDPRFLCILFISQTRDQFCNWHVGVHRCEIIISRSCPDELEM